VELRFAPLELASLDAPKIEVLCLTMFSDERPPRGVLGLADWRLCGRLSRLLATGAFAAREGEALLMPSPPRRLAAERLLVVGAGERPRFDAVRARSLVFDLFRRVLALRVRTAAVALPHASARGWNAEAAVDHLLEATSSAGDRLDELVIIDTAEAQRAMEPRIERAKRRALAGPY
jgi:hypothetical protein